jgi:hypothetical protein
VREVGDDVAHARALHAVREVRGSEHGGGGQDHGARLHDREHRLPQLDPVPEHEHHVVALPHAEPHEPGRDAVGARGHLVEGEAALGSVARHDASNQSTAQLKESPTSGQRKRSTADVRWVRISCKRSRAAR